MKLDVNSLSVRAYNYISAHGIGPSEIRSAIRNGACLRWRNIGLQSYKSLLKSVGYSIRKYPFNRKFVPVRSGFLICPQCGEVMAKASSVTRRRSTNNHYDGNVTESNPHGHDDRCLVRKYYCKRGHTKEVSIVSTCNKCDWRGSEHCFCSEKFESWPKFRSLVPQQELTGMCGRPEFVKSGKIESFFK